MSTPSLALAWASDSQSRLWAFKEVFRHTHARTHTLTGLANAVTICSLTCKTILDHGYLGEYVQPDSYLNLLPLLCIEPSQKLQQIPSCCLGYNLRSHRFSKSKQRQNATIHNLRASFTISLEKTLKNTNQKLHKFNMRLALKNLF